jgi:hypothetical protein
MLYPKPWRERYSEEVGDLSAELLAAGETTRLRLALELARSVLAERVRSLRRSRFVLVLSGSAALIVVVVVAFLATNGFGLGSTSPRATLVGWSVSYRGAQVSVPPSAVAHSTGPGGDPWVNFQAIPPAADGGICTRPFGGTMLCLLPMRQVPPAYAGEKPTMINGVPVYLGPKGDYYAPSLDVEVTASGPLSSRVVATLTRIPLPSLCSRYGSRPLVCSLSSTVVSLGTITRAN